MAVPHLQSAGARVTMKIKRLFHRCAVPPHPIIEDQASWACPECGGKWEYIRLFNEYETWEEWSEVDE